MPNILHRHQKLERQRRHAQSLLTWLCVTALVLFSSSSFAAWVAPSVAISNLNTQVYVYEATIDKMVGFWLNATNCTDVDNALVAGSVYVSAPVNVPDATTNNVTLQFPSWAMNWPYDRIVVCARDAATRAATVAADSTGTSHERQTKVMLDDSANLSSTTVTTPLTATLIWPPVPLRELLAQGESTPARGGLIAAVAEVLAEEDENLAVSFDALGTVQFYDLHHAPVQHRISAAQSEGGVAEALFYVGLRERVVENGVQSSRMMPSFCANAECSTTVDTGRELSFDEAQYVLSVLEHSVLYIYPTLSTMESSSSSSSEQETDACGTLYRQHGSVTFIADGQIVPTANITVEAFSGGSEALPTPSAQPRWLVAGTFTNLTSDQYAEGRYPLCVSPAFIYLTEATVTPTLPDWSSVQGEGMAGLTTLVTGVYTLTATSALASESAVMWDTSGTIVVHAASRAAWFSDEPTATVPTVGYTVVAGGRASATEETNACTSGTVLFEGTLLEVSAEDELARRTPRLRFGPSSLTMPDSDVVASAEEWAALFSTTATETESVPPEVVLSVCLALDGSREATTWAGTVSLTQLYTYSSIAMVAPPLARTTLTTTSSSNAGLRQARVDQDDLPLTLCAVPAWNAFTSDTTASYFLSTSSSCTGQRYTAPHMMASGSAAAGEVPADTNPVYDAPTSGLDYVLCVALTSDSSTPTAEEEEVSGSSDTRPIHILTMPSLASPPSEVFYDEPFTLSITADTAASAAALSVFAIPAAEYCESPSCPPDASYTPTLVQDAAPVVDGNVTITIPLSASAGLEEGGGVAAVRLCASLSTPSFTRSVSLATVPVSVVMETTTTTTEAPPPIWVAGVHPTTIVKGQPIELHSQNLQSGNANLAYDADCAQFLFSPSITIQAGRVAVSVPRCLAADEAYYCERQGPSYPYKSTALLTLVTLFDCSTNALVNLVPVAVPPATAVTMFGVSNGTITNTTPFLSQQSDCSVAPSLFAQEVQASGYMTALGDVTQFYVCVTSLDGTLNFTNTAVGPTLTIDAFLLDPAYSTLGVRVTAQQQTPPVPIPDTTFVIRDLAMNGWSGEFRSNAAPVATWPNMNSWTSALCNTSVPDSSGNVRPWWNASALGRGETVQWLLSWGSDISDTAAYYGALGRYYVCSDRAKPDAPSGDAEGDEEETASSSSGSGSGGSGEESVTPSEMVPVSSFLALAPPVAQWLAPPVGNAFVCVRLLVPGGFYSLLGASMASWSDGVYLMPTTESAFANALDTNTNLCEDGPYTTPSSAATPASELRDGFSGVGVMTAANPDVVCLSTLNLSASADQIYLLCSGTPDGYQQTNTTTTLATLEVSPVDLTAGATPTMTLPDWPSTNFILTPSAAGCSAIPEGMPKFTTNETGMGETTLVVTSNSLGVPLRPLDAGTYTLCHQQSWQSPALTRSSAITGAAADEAGWTTHTAWLPLTTVEVHDAVFYDISTHALALNVTSTVFLTRELTAGVLKPGFYTSPDCSDESMVSPDWMTWSPVENTEESEGNSSSGSGASSSSSTQLLVTAYSMPARSAADMADRVYLCAFTTLNATYQPVPNNEGGIRVLAEPFFFRTPIHPCEQMDVFVNNRRAFDENTAAIELVNGPCCVPTGAVASWSVVAQGARLGRFYRSFLLNDTVLDAIAPTATLSVCARYHDISLTGSVDSLWSCMTAGAVTVLVEASYCDVNPSVLPFLVLAPRANIYGLLPTFLRVTWSVLIAIAVVAGVVLLFAIAVMIVCCALKRKPRKLVDEPDMDEALAQQTTPLWTHVATPSTLAEAEAAAARKRAEPHRGATLEKQVVDSLQSQLMPGLSPKEVADCLPFSLRNTPYAMHMTSTVPAAAVARRGRQEAASYDPVALYLGQGASAAAAGGSAEASSWPSATVPVDATTSSAQPSASHLAPALTAPEKTLAKTSQPPLASAPSPSPSPSPHGVSSAHERAAPSPLPQQALGGPISDLEVEEAAARAVLEGEEDDALYSVLEKERCRWRDLMAGEGVRLKTLLQQDPFWSSRLAMLEGINARARERAERSATRDRSVSSPGAGTNNEQEAWADPRTQPAPPPPPPFLSPAGGSDDEDVFSAASGVMTPLSETVLVFPVAGARRGPAAPPPPPSATPPKTTRAKRIDEEEQQEQQQEEEQDGLHTMQSHVSDEDADDALDLDESLFSSASAGGSHDGEGRRKRRLELLRTPEASGPPAATTAATHRDPQPQIYHAPPFRDAPIDTDEADSSLFSDLSGGGSGVRHAPRWTPPPAPPIQQPPPGQAAPATDEMSEFSEQSAHASVPRPGGMRAPPKESPTYDVPNPLPLPLTREQPWESAGSGAVVPTRRGDGQRTPPALPPNAEEDTEGTQSSGTGLLYSPASGNRRVTMPRAALSPSAGRPHGEVGGVQGGEAARALSWSPPSAMASAPREEPRAARQTGTGQPAAGAGQKKDSRYDNLYLDEL